MAYKMPQMIAGGTIRPARFVKVSTAANKTLLEADAAEKTIGISTSAGKDVPYDGATTSYAAGDHMEWFGPGEVCQLEIGSGGVTAGARIKSDADGKGVVSVTDGQFYGAIALEAASEGEFAEVFVENGQASA